MRKKEESEECNEEEQIELCSHILTSESCLSSNINPLLEYVEITDYGCGFF